jgi:predicted hotdog family 3-hydroxylacyl-ACP dehydratase
MAQCVAVHAGACERVHGYPPPMGMLLGTRHFKVSETYLEIGRTYQTRCEELIRGSDGVAAFTCNISYDGQVIVNTRLSVWQLTKGNKFNE